jgi:hypothetical protein
MSDISDSKKPHITLKHFLYLVAYTNCILSVDGCEIGLAINKYKYRDIRYSDCEKYTITTVFILMPLHENKKSPKCHTTEFTQNYAQILVRVRKLQNNFSYQQLV